MVTIDSAYIRSVLEDVCGGKINTETALALIEGHIDLLVDEQQVDHDDSSTADLRRRVELLERL